MRGKKRIGAVAVAWVLGGACGGLPAVAPAQIIIRDRDSRTSRDDGDARQAERARQAREARAETERAEANLRAAATRVRASWKANPELLAAEKELDAAREARDAERRRVVQSLERDPAYTKLRSEHAEATRDVRAEQERVNATQPATQPSAAALPDPSSAQVAAATDKLEAKNELRDFENRAVAADPNASAAVARFEAAQEKMKVLQAQLNAALLNDPEYKAAQEQVSAARARTASPALP